MTDYLAKPCAAFEGSRLLCAGPLIEVVLAAKDAMDRNMPLGNLSAPVFVFEDTTGRVLDFDLRGSKAEIVARLSQSSPAAVLPAGRQTAGPDSDVAMTEDATGEPRGRGRPKLGVIGREVTLLPRHWDWLATQPGGASVALRKLVDEARRSGGDLQRKRAAQEAAYRFMSAMAGDLPGFEEAARALFAQDRARFEQQIAGWPGDIRAYTTRLAFAGTGGSVA